MLYHGLRQPDPSALEDTRKFIDLLRQPGVFTKVIVHQNLDPNEIAYHVRKPWGQDGSAFDFLEHTIVIDGVVSTTNLNLLAWSNDTQRFQTLCSLMGKSGKDDVRQRRRLIFMFFHAICHELGHVFITYLNKGLGETPPKICDLQMLGNVERT
jgi:hypothetical protein